MSVMRATALFPMCAAVSSRSEASDTASSGVFMNAPEPNLTSSTSPEMPSASFLERMLPVMRGRLSIVEVTSRSA